ncbi:MAG: universal stress protein, partial [Betaproteobacteria bacterium]|nr:universal stress protein [Betaproteobacteria bacterium]
TQYAAQLAQALREKSKITLISVHDDTGFKHLRKFTPKGALADYLRELSDKDLKASRKYLDKLELAHDMIIKTGHVAEEIVNTAKAGKFDLIVMGAKGRSAFGDLLLGSVSQRVASTSNAAVALVK